MMRRIKGAVFDIDGTLLDSMTIWKDAGVRYLASLGVRARPDLTKQLNALSMPEGAVYMKREYGLLLSQEEIIQGVNHVVEEFYLKEAQLKPGVESFLKYLFANGVKMIVSTALDVRIAQPVLKRTGIMSYFSEIVTCEEAGAGKTKPNVFFLAKEKLGITKEETWVFEDSLYAVKTAVQAGFPVCAVYDEYSDADQEQIQELADIYLKSFVAGENIFQESGQHTLKKVLTIAGSDSCGGAGIQADIKTLTAHGVYSMSAITALTAQNTRGISGILPVPEEFFRKQMDSIFSDIVPDAVKTGMIYSGRQAEITASYLREYSIKNVVIDPVMVSTSGTELTEKYADQGFFYALFPLARMITPNLPEAEILSGQKILPELSESQSRKTRENAARVIGERFDCAVFLKGGHASENADDLLYENGEFTWFPADRIDNPNTHGTGCTLSSAIAANLALGFSLKEAVRLAKEYVNGAIAAKLVIGSGNGPLDHMWNFKNMCKDL